MANVKKAKAGVLPANTTRAQTATVNLDVLKSVVEANAKDEAIYLSQEDGGPLVAAGYIEVSADIFDESNNPAARATDTGKALIAEQGSDVNEAPKPGTIGQVKPNLTPFSIEKGIAKPSVNALKGRALTYPFDSMELDDSFFVPSTEAKPNPAKSLGSTVSSANERFKEAGDARRFKVYRIEAGVNGATENGARVFRVI